MIRWNVIVNSIEKQLMKVIKTMKNQLNQEFEHWMESQFTEVMNLKMHAI